MLKKLLLVIVFLFGTLLFGAGEYDKDIVVKNQSRNDKVKTVFREMMNAYEEEDLNKFFSYVSEDRFLQDYMTFYEAIEQDIRTYDILSVDTWVNKITDDGVKRFLYVQWEKRYLATNNDEEITKRGYSRFLFDEVNGKYKLIELAGNHFWGGSLPEWREEVPKIAGQVEEALLPDLTVEIVSCISGTLSFKIKNIGEGATTSGVIEYDTKENGSYTGQVGTYDDDLEAGEEVSLSRNVGCNYLNALKVDPNNLIEESNEANNEVAYGGGVVTGPW